MNATTVSSENAKVKNVTPPTTNTGCVGSSTERFSNAYFGYANMNSVTINTSIGPDSNNGASLAASGSRFSAGYFTALDATNFTLNNVKQPVIRTGSSAPASSLGSDGDIYIRYL